MKAIPKQVRGLFRELFVKFSSVKGEDYKQHILNEAKNDEERKDLEELFQATAEYHDTRNEIVDSNKSAAQYLLDFYMEKWNEEHPNASEEERKKAIDEYEEAIGNVAVQTLSLFEKDGLLRRKLERAVKDCKSEEEREAVIQALLSENEAFGTEKAEEGTEAGSDGTQRDENANASNQSVQQM